MTQLYGIRKYDLHHLTDMWDTGPPIHGLKQNLYDKCDTEKCLEFIFVDTQRNWKIQLFQDPRSNSGPDEISEKCNQMEWVGN
ncbi:uncharacterized protein OCT59_021827 [Rhizophagus irregularis]|uniref:uncharacterized protein n=1 Tax=Rhizophagus irregularis TaxID=588596 RepID=UPI0033267308|nr:hypothetical protein OCT59_021827 [Rhizophagus irregularis]